MQLSKLSFRPPFYLLCSFSEPNTFINSEKDRNNGFDTRFASNHSETSNETSDDWNEIMRLEKCFYMRKVLQILESDRYNDIDKLKTLELCLFPSMADKYTSNIMGGNLFGMDGWSEEDFSAK